MKGVWSSTVQYRTVWSQESHFSKKLEIENCAPRDPGPQFFGPADFKQPMLKERGEAHWTTSKLTTFASFQLIFIVEHAQPFRLDMKIPKPTLEGS